MSLEIAKILTVSTGHIPKPENNPLVKGWLETHAHEYDCGWFISTDFATLDCEVPVSVLPVLELGKENECAFVRLDCDGGKVESLPTYAW